MTRPKLKWWLLMGVLVLGAVGCTPDERLAALQTQARQAERVVDSIDAVLPSLEQGIVEAKGVLADPNIPAGTKDKVLAALTSAQAEAERYKAVRVQVAGTLVKLTTAIEAIRAGGEATVGQELELYGQIAKEGSRYAPPQYSGYVYLAGLVMTLIGGIFGGKKSQEAVAALQVAEARNEAQNAVEESDGAEEVLKDVVLSVDKLLSTLRAAASPDVFTDAKDALRTQSPDTQAEVKRIKASNPFAL